MRNPRIYIIIQISPKNQSERDDERREKSKSEKGEKGEIEPCDIITISFPRSALLADNKAASDFFLEVSAASIRALMSGPRMPAGGAEDAAEITEGLRDGDLVDFAKV